LARALVDREVARRCWLSAPPSPSLRMWPAPRGPSLSAPTLRLNARYASGARTPLLSLPALLARRIRCAVAAVRRSPLPHVGVRCLVCNWSPCVQVWQQMEVDPLVRSMWVPDAWRQRRVPAGEASPLAGTLGDHPVAKAALSGVFCAKL
jgi:hypothetical protein